MAEGRTTSRVPLIVAGVVVALCAVAVVAAFYLFDGANLIMGLFEGDPPPAATPSSTPATSTALSLPEGMEDEFALRVWQEQVDSQLMITRLVEGKVASLELGAVDEQGDLAIIEATAVLTDGTRLPGVVGLRRFGDEWYIAYLSAARDGASAAVPDSELPTMNEVDLAALKTVMQEQGDSQEIIKEYLDGTVRRIVVVDTVEGPDTATIKLAMDEDHEEAYADLVAIRLDFEGEEIWFLTTFEKTGTEPKK